MKLSLHLCLKSINSIWVGLFMESWFPLICVDILSWIHGKPSKQIVWIFNFVHFFQYYISILILLPFHIYLESIYIYKFSRGIEIEVSLHLQIIWGGKWTWTMLSTQIHEHNLFLHLLRSLFPSSWLFNVHHIDSAYYNKVIFFFFEMESYMVLVYW